MSLLLLFMLLLLQVPIELSPPWFLTEHLLSSSGRVLNSPMLENALFVLDIYNDAAHSALFVRNQQFFYDEIEAELNLALDQVRWPLQCIPLAFQNSLC